MSKVFCRGVVLFCLLAVLLCFLECKEANAELELSSNFLSDTFHLARSQHVTFFVMATDASATARGSNPSVGTLLAAALETAGYQVQAQILSQLKSLLSQLGALIYLGVIISVILTVSLSGSYRAALWLLAGPTIFYLLCHKTVQASGAEWQFGVFSDAQRSRELNRVLAGSQVRIRGEVSNFFHLYNVFISNSFQHLVSLVTNRQMLAQMRFMARQRLLDDLFSLELDNPNLRALVGFFYAHCHQEIAYATMIGMGNREQRRIAATNANYLGFRASPEYQAAVANYCERFPARDKPFPPGPWQQYVVNPPPSGLGESPNPDIPVHLFRRGWVTHATVSCAQLWRWTVVGARAHVNQATQTLMNRDIEPYGPRVFGPQFRNNLLTDVGTRIGGLGPGRNLDPCPNAAERFSQQINNPIISRFFAGMLIRDQLMQDPRGMMFSQFTEHSRVSLQRSGIASSSDPDKKERIIRRLRAQELAESQKYEAFWLLMALPYLQGVILFALAATFPFFAMMTLLPGQAGAFFLWMALWAWAKSWDLGWALVMVADNVLWELLPKVSYYDFPGNNKLAAGEFDTPVNLLDAMFSGDHSYSLASYWLLLNLMIGAVPVLSAQAVLGSKRAIAGVLIDGLRAMGAKLGSTAGDWIAHEQIERNDVRAVRSAVDSVRARANLWFGAYREEMRRFDDLYGGGLFGRLVWRPAVAFVQTARSGYYAGLVELDRRSAIYGITLGTNFENTRGNFEVGFQQHIGRPVMELQVQVNRHVARPILQEFGRRAVEATNTTLRYPGVWAANTQRFAYNWTVGWVQPPMRYLRNDDAPQINMQQANQVIREVVEVVAPVYTPNVPAQWRNLTAADLRAQLVRAEADARQARERLLLGLVGIRNQLGQAEYELRRRIEMLREEFGRTTGLDMYGVLLGRTPDGRMGRMSTLYFGRTPDSEIEQTLIIGLNRSMDSNMRGVNARPEIDEAMAEIERLRMRAYLLESGSEILSVGSVTVGAVVGYVSKDPALGASIVLGGLHGAYQMNSTSIDMHRLANSRAAECLELNANAWLYDAYNSQEWYFSQEIRAGISLRGEWWNVPEIPYEVFGSANQLAARIRTEATYLEGALLGDLAWTVIFAGTKGKAIPSSM